MKRKMMQAMAGFVVSAMVLTGCGGGAGSGAATGGNTGAAAPAQQEQTQEDTAATEAEQEGTADQPAETTASGAANIKIMWWGPENRHTATLEAIDLYTSQNPNVSFTPEYLGWDAYWPKLTVLSASNTLPDLLQMDAQYINTYVSKGQLADISSLDLTGIVDEQILEHIKIDGKLYGIPLGRNGTGYAYNKVDLEAAGVKLPFDGWTWDDYFAFAEEGGQKLPDGIYAINDSTNNLEYYQYYQTSQGKGPVITEDSKLSIDQDLWLEYARRLEDYRERGIVAPAAETLSFIENDVNADPLASKKVMTRGATVGSVGALLGLLPDKDIQVVGQPVGPAGGGWSQSTIFFAVAESAQYKEEAMNFGKWFISDVPAGEVLRTVRGIPISDAVFSAIESDLSPGDLIGKKLLDASALQPLPFYPVLPDWTGFVDEYKATMESVMFKDMTIEAAYDKLMKLGQEVEASQQ